MKIHAVDHVSINLADAEKSYDFYERILGLKRGSTIDCGEFEITYFELPDHARLELFDYRGANSGTSRQESEIGLRHIAFRVQDVGAHEKLLREAGVEIALPTSELPELGVRVLLFLDPNGVTLEFCEPL